MTDTLIVACPHCHTRNRIPQNKLGHEAKCGKCGSRFTATENIVSTPVKVTDSTFPQEVLESLIPVLVDFWAPWCGPCRMIAPVLEELSREYAGRIKIAKLNTDENQQTAAQFHIQGIPTLLFVKNGEVIDKVVGVTPKQELSRRIQQIL